MKLFISTAFVLFFGLCNGALITNDKLKQLIANTKWILYYGPRMSDGISYGFYDLPALTNDRRFNPAKPTVMYVHGFLESQSKESVKVIHDAYISRDRENLIVLDWAYAAAGNYLGVLLNAISLSKVAGLVLVNTFNHNLLHRQAFQLIGHSMGAQFASGIAKTLISFNLKLDTIIGLDPAGPLNYVLPAFLSGSHLTHADATFVVILITDMTVYGHAFPTGTVNAFMNGGMCYQPGCPFSIPFSLTPNDLCSHQRSWRFWAETVRSPPISDPLQAIGALNWFSFIIGLTQPNNIVKIGPNMDRTARGNFYVQTSRASPFSRGVAGTHYRFN